MDKISGAEAMMRSLEHEGVDILFGYPGGAIMPTYDALYDHRKTLHHVLVRHEQAAVHAAQGYARVSGKVGCAIVTSGLSIGHISPEAASGGAIGKIKDGDIIVIDIPSRSINVKLSDEELAARPQQPLKRNRVVSKALRAYAQSVSSADKGGVRIID